MHNIRPEDLGSMGESFFNTLCKNIGFVANSSKSDDKGGWDFEVEHRRTKQINYSSQSYPVYRVQVKSTKGKKQTKLTYSNLLKLIQYSGASFIALIKYSKNVTPDSAFIFHIDENFSKTILKKIREKQIKLKNFALNKNEKIIKFSSKDEIKPLDGKGLKIAFSKHIGSDYLTYVENKLKYLSKFEKEGQLKQFVLTFKNEKDIRAMANCCLGYQENFNINLSAYNAPFGIRDEVPISTFEDHNTTITPNYDKLTQTVICFKTSKFGKQYEFTGTTYTVPQQLRQVSAKARTECILFDFLFDYDTSSIKIESKNIFSGDIKVTFKELYNFFCFLNDSMSSNETYIKLVDTDSNKTAEVCLGALEFDFPDDFQILFEAITSTYKKLCDLNLEYSVISTKYIWDNIGRFNLFCIMDKEYTPDFVMEFKNQGNEEPDVNVVIFNSAIELNKTNLIIFVAFYGTVERVCENVLLGKFNKSEFLGEYLVNTGEDTEELIDLKSEYYRNIFIEKGFKVLN